MKSVFIKAIEFYQKRISPYTMSHCRYYPTCSEYAKISILERGWFFGIIYTIMRVCRCWLLFRGGIDYPANSLKKEIKKYSKFIIFNPIALNQNHSESSLKSFKESCCGQDSEHHSEHHDENTNNKH